MLSLICLACTFAEFTALPSVEQKLNQTIETECFAEQMDEFPTWLRAMRTKDVDIRIKYYKEDNNVLGFFDPGSSFININRKFKGSTCQQASTIAHESLHVLGFRHFGDAAYTVNDAFKACCFE